MKKTSGMPLIFKHQEDAGLDQNDPSSGTKYEWKASAGAGAALGTQKNVRIISIVAQVTWTVQPSPLQIHITIDGVALEGSQTDPVTATPYFAKLRGNLTTIFLLDTTDFAYARPFLIEGRSIKIEFETTGGTVSNLSARVKWQKIP